MGFEKVYKVTALFEGGYSDNPKDRGGPTNFGITEEVARANGFLGDMKDLPRGIARNIAKSQYWDVMRLDAIDELSPVLAQELYDTGLNCGVSTAGKFLQRALNVFNRGQTLYKDLAVDGIIGPVTIMHMKLFMQERQLDADLVMMRALNALQGAYYIEIAEKREQNEEFTFGWFRDRVQLY